jgi:hypothetical protein
MKPSSFSAMMSNFIINHLAGLVDPKSGVICIPNNYNYGEGRHLDEGWLRVTALANHDAWCRLPESDYVSS